MKHYYVLKSGNPFTSYQSMYLGIQDGSKYLVVQEDGVLNASFLYEDGSFQLAIGRFDHHTKDRRWKELTEKEAYLLLGLPYDLPKEKAMTRSKLFHIVANSIDMQEAAGIEPVCKCRRDVLDISSRTFFSVSSDYEFPLAVVEGRAVFVGDVLYNTSAKATDGSAFIVSYATVGLWNTEGRGGLFGDLSWTQPKPKTVMVELLVEDAKAFGYRYQNLYSNIKRVDIAIKDALDKLVK